MAASIYDWSGTAASNSNADSDIAWPEGQAPSTVNNSARAMMQRVQELLEDIGGSLSASGTADGLLVTAGSAYSALADGRIISFRATADNTGAATLNVNGIGAKAIRKMAPSGDVALGAGDIQATGIYVAQYSAALNAAAGAWLLVNPTLVNINAGTGTFSGALTAATGTFSGALSATTGTFSGALTAPTGTFSGAIVGDSGSFNAGVFAASGTVSGAFLVGSLQATGTDLVLASSPGGGVFLRPGGVGVSGNQLSVDNSGNVVINGVLTVTG